MSLSDDYARLWSSDLGLLPVPYLPNDTSPDSYS
jgi:hypothetical protein